MALLIFIKSKSSQGKCDIARGVEETVNVFKAVKAIKQVVYLFLCAI